MSEFKKITAKELAQDPKALNVNPFELIGKAWGLFTAGSVSDYNTMTVSWGTMGIFWDGRPVVNCFVSPQRYTYEFIEKQEHFTLSFYIDSKYREMLAFCGSKSGRDVDKAKECGLTVMGFDGAAGFAEADIVISAKKIYYYDLDQSNMLDPSIMNSYPANDFHRCYFGEIKNIYTK